MSISAVNTRNQFRGQVVAIHRGDVVSEVEIETSAGIIGAIVTSSSIDRLKLRVGDDALALFKASDIQRFADMHVDDELVLQLRYRTRGAADARNVQPFEVVPGLLLMHNGEVDVPRRLADRSDTWHLVNDHLRPLLERRRELALERGFLRLFEQSLGPSNRVVLLSQPTRRIDILNAAPGVQYNGLWLSSTRWIDHSILEIPGAPQPQRRSYNATGLSFA